MRFTKKSHSINTPLFSICFILTNTQLNYAVTHPLFYYMIQIIFVPLAGLEMRVTQIFVIFP